MKGMERVKEGRLPALVECAGRSMYSGFKRGGVRMHNQNTRNLREESGKGKGRKKDQATVERHEYHHRYEMRKTKK